MHASQYHSDSVAKRGGGASVEDASSRGRLSPLGIGRTTRVERKAAPASSLTLALPLASSPHANDKPSVAAASRCCHHLNESGPACFSLHVKGTHMRGETPTFLCVCSPSSLHATPSLLRRARHLTQKCERCREIHLIAPRARGAGDDPLRCRLPRTAVPPFHHNLASLNITCRWHHSLSRAYLSGLFSPQRRLCFSSVRACGGIPFRTSLNVRFLIPVNRRPCHSSVSIGTHDHARTSRASTNTGDAAGRRVLFTARVAAYLV